MFTCQMRDTLINPLTESLDNFKGMMMLGNKNQSQKKQEVNVLQYAGDTFISPVKQYSDKTETVYIDNRISREMSDIQLRSSICSRKSSFNNSIGTPNVK